MQLTINSFKYDTVTMHSDSPIVFDVDETPVKDDNGNIVVSYSIDDENYNISAFGDSIEELTQEVQNELEYNWKTYALVDSSHLSDKAKIVKQNLLEHFYAT